jgi:hypothetical protein
MSSSKTPIRQDEKDYLDHFIETKYDDRKNVLKTEMQDTIDKEAEDNFEAFKDKLKINKMHDDIKVLYDDHAKFANEMDSILLQKKGKLDNAVNVLEDKLEQWKKVRKWKNEISSSLLREPDELDRLLKKLCHEETERDYYSGPRGKAIQMLDMSKEYGEYSIKKWVRKRLILILFLSQSSYQLLNNNKHGKCPVLCNWALT